MAGPDPRGAFRSVLNVTNAIDSALSVVGALMVLAVMLIVSADVAFRYVIGAPFSWAYDLIGLYLMPGICFLFLSDTFRHHGHIAVDIAQNSLSPRLRHLSLCIAYAASAIVFLVIFWSNFQRAWQSYAAKEVLAGAIPWPMWIAVVFVVVGSALLLVRLVVAVLGHAVVALSGKSAYPLPPLSGDEGAH